MPTLWLLRADHAEELLAFETANRAYFAARISDRGDAYFAEFGERLDALVAEQRTGAAAFHVLVADDGTVVGRFNLTAVVDGGAELGYRVAEHAAGKGLATASVRELCRAAPALYGVHRIRAATALTNVASQRVLVKAGFVEAGPAEPGGQPGTWYECLLTTGSSSPSR